MTYTSAIGHFNLYNCHKLPLKSVAMKVVETSGLEDYTTNSIPGLTSPSIGDTDR
jgi:hypothetical protein